MLQCNQFGSLSFNESICLRRAGKLMCFSLCLHPRWSQQKHPQNTVIASMILVSKEMRILDMLDYHQLCMIYDYYFILMNECKWNDAIVKNPTLHHDVVLVYQWWSMIIRLCGTHLLLMHETSFWALLTHGVKDYISQHFAQFQDETDKIFHYNTKYM